jgi:hypothetical protein
MTGGMDFSEVTNETSQGVKRRRVAVACDACRTRKSRVCLLQSVEAIQPCASRHSFMNRPINERSVMELVHDVQYASI